MCEQCDALRQQIHALEGRQNMGRMGSPSQQRRRRAIDVQTALQENRSVGWLSSRWNVTVSAASEWLKNNISVDDHKALAANGKTTCGPRTVDTALRLELVAVCKAAGWSQARIARAIGIAESALSFWLKRNAPFGVEDALQDFSNDEEAA